MPTGADEYSLDQQIGYLLRRAYQRHSMLFLEEMPHGLTPTQFAAMVRLEQLGPCSQNQLGRHTAMDVATIKGVVDRLRARGLVQVGVDEHDRRRSKVSLTDSGVQIMGRARAAGRHISGRTLQALNEQEQNQLLSLLGRIAD